MDANELFGSYNVLQFALVYQVGKDILKLETSSGRVATEEEQINICRKAREAHNIRPQDDIVNTLRISAEAFSSSDEGPEFCKKFDAKKDRSFIESDVREVSAIVKNFVAQFMSQR